MVNYKYIESIYIYNVCTMMALVTGVHVTVETLRRGDA